MADQITVKMVGTDKALKDVKKFTLKKIEGVKAVLERTGRKVELSAKEFCTERFKFCTERFKEPSGRLMASITTDTSNLNKNIVRTGTNVKYARPVEHGHVQEPGRFVPAIGKRLVRDFVPGKPYLFPAFFMHEGDIEKGLKKEFKKI